MPKSLTANSPLRDYLRMPELKPALEYVGGRIVQKMSPMLPHSVIQGELRDALNIFARPLKLGRAYTELRAVYGGSARVADVSYYSANRLPKILRREDPIEVTLAPDIVVEILSPGQTTSELRKKVQFSIRHGSRLGWLIHPKRERVDVLGPNREIRSLRIGEALTGEDVLPGFSLPLEVLFGWLDEE